MLCRTEFETAIARVLLRDKLRDAPKFSGDSWEDRDWEARAHEHHGVPAYWELKLGPNGNVPAAAERIDVQCAGGKTTPRLLRRAICRTFNLSQTGAGSILG